MRGGKPKEFLGRHLLTPMNSRKGGLTWTCRSNNIGNRPPSTPTTYSLCQYFHMQEHTSKEGGARSGESAVDLVSFVEFQRNHRWVAIVTAAACRHRCRLAIYGLIASALSMICATGPTYLSVLVTHGKPLILPHDRLIMNVHKEALVAMKTFWENLLRDKVPQGDLPSDEGYIDVVLPALTSLLGSRLSRHGQPVAHHPRPLTHSDGEMALLPLTGHL